MAIDTARIEPGQRVLVTAAGGGVGHLAVQIAKARGAYVIGTASAAKHEFLRGVGVDETVDYTATDVHTAVREVDAVIQMFGGEPGLRELECLRPGGVLVNAQTAWTPGMSERARELGVRATGFLVEPDATGLESLASLVDRCQLSVHVDREFRLADVAAAHELVAKGRTTGKVILTVADQA